MDLTERNLAAIAGFVLVFLVLAAVAWLGRDTGTIDALGMRPTQTPTPVIVRPKLPTRRASN